MYTDWLFRALLSIKGELWEAKGIVSFGKGRTFDLAAACAVFEDLKRRLKGAEEGTILAVSVLPIIGVEPLFINYGTGFSWETKIAVKKRSPLLTIGDWIKEGE